MTSQLFALCFEAIDPLRLARFWAGVLDWRIGNRFLADCGFIGALSSDGSQHVGYFWSEVLAGRAMRKVGPSRR